MHCTVCPAVHLQKAACHVAMCVRMYGRQVALVSMQHRVCKTASLYDRPHHHTAPTAPYLLFGRGHLGLHGFHLLKQLHGAGTGANRLQPQSCTRRLCRHPSEQAGKKSSQPGCCCTWPSKLVAALSWSRSAAESSFCFPMLVSTCRQTSVLSIKLLYPGQGRHPLCAEARVGPWVLRLQRRHHHRTTLQLGVTQEEQLAPQALSSAQALSPGLAGPLLWPCPAPAAAPGPELWHPLLPGPSPGPLFWPCQQLGLSPGLPTAGR